MNSATSRSVSYRNRRSSDERHVVPLHGGLPAPLGGDENIVETGALMAVLVTASLMSRHVGRAIVRFHAAPREVVEMVNRMAEVIGRKNKGIGYRFRERQRGVEGHPVIAPHDFP